MSINISDSVSFPHRITRCGITIDISKQALTNADWSEWLLPRAAEAEMFEAHTAMMSGKVINHSEHRRALHTLLRASKSRIPDFVSVQEERNRALRFAEEVRSGVRLGCRQNRLKDIINIGIGGSETGVKTVWHALKPLHPDIRLHFLSAADGVLLA